MKNIRLLILVVFTFVSLQAYRAEGKTKCESNKDCGVDQFCEGGDKSCSFKRNRCLPLEKGEIRIFKERSFLISPSPMGWWAAKNWCEANNMHLVSLKTLGLQAPNEYCYHSDCLSDAGKNISDNDWKEFRASFGKDWFWVNDPHATCDSFRVAPVLELLAYSGRPTNLKALCE